MDGRRRSPIESRHYLAKQIVLYVFLFKLPKIYTVFVNCEQWGYACAGVACRVCSANTAYIVCLYSLEVIKLLANLHSALIVFAYTI